MMSALYVQVRAAQLGLLLSDNNLFNFGVAFEFGGVVKPTGSFNPVTDKKVWREKLARQPCCVVILDTGSRALKDPGAITKGEQNRTCMTKWWKKLKVQTVDPGDYAEVFRVWRHFWDIEGLVGHLRQVHYCQVAAPDVREEDQEIVESRFTNAPLFRKICQNHEDEGVVQWYVETFLSNRLGCLLHPTACACRLKQRDLKHRISS